MTAGDMLIILALVIGLVWLLGRILPEDNTPLPWEPDDDNWRD